MMTLNTLPTKYRILALRLLAVAAIAFFDVAPAFCQSASPDPVKQKLQDEKDKADLQKAIADDQKSVAESNAAKLKAEYSISTDKLPQGNATLGDKVNIEGTILAYRAAQAAAPKIGVIITGNSTTCPSSFLFFDSKQMNDIWGVRVLKEQFKLIQQQGAVLTQGPEAAGIIPVGAAIEAGLTLLSLFKTDTNIQGVAVTGDDSALLAALAVELKTKCPNASVIDPVHFIPQVQPTTSTSVLGGVAAITDLRNSINDKSTKAQADAKSKQKTLDDLKSKLDANAKQASDLKQKIEDLTKKLAAATTTAQQNEIKKQLKDAQDALVKNQNEKTDLQAKSDELSKDIDKLTGYAGKATAFVSSVDALNTTLTKVDDSGMSLLNRMLRAESLLANLDDKSEYVSAHFLAMGGNNITKKNFFSTSISFSGGTVIDYIVTDSMGKTLKSGILPVYGKKISEGDLNKSLD